MKLQDALGVAQDYLELFKPFCERIEIAGSIRRKKAEVKDIELVAVPKLIEIKDLFGNVQESRNEMEAVFADLKAAGRKFVKDGKRYKQIFSPDDFIKIDLFMVLPPAEWGVTYVLRTGPADFSKKLVTQRSKGGLLPDGYWVADGHVTSKAGVVPMSEETDYFKLLGIDFISPELRS